MLIVDDLLLSPMHGILWIFREIHKAAQQEIQGAAEVITAELSELYMMLETKKITEQEFDEQEKLLLDRLDKAQNYMDRATDGAETEEEPADDVGEMQSGE